MAEVLKHFAVFVSDRDSHNDTPFDSIDYTYCNIQRAVCQARRKLKFIARRDKLKFDFPIKKDYTERGIKKGGTCMRLFIAVPVTGAGKALQSTQAALQRSGVRGRFSPPEKLHITLAFLGSVDDPAPVFEALERVPVPKTSLSFDRLTLFGDALVALFQQNGALERYVAALRTALDEAGVSCDRKAVLRDIDFLTDYGVDILTISDKPDSPKQKYIKRT